ncbi:MAG: autoinducer binding domain-containing protein [Pseudomonadota bacterium]
MQRYFGQIEALDDIGEVLMYSRNMCNSKGILRQSYHFTPIFDEPNSMNTVVYSDGFSSEWLELYDQSDFRLSDPIPARTMEYGRLLTWKEAMAYAPNSPENEAYFAAMREHGLEHGFGIPLYGPRGRNSYASFDFGRAISADDNASLGMIRSLSQAGHQRICVLIDEATSGPELSERETEVMGWIARGKSMSTIATILELSPDTVKTYAKRIYAKLGASDRVGATVKALKLGLVHA